MSPTHGSQKHSESLRRGKPCGNELLAALPSTVSRGLIARCEPVDLQFGATVCEQGDRIQHVYFPIDGFVSLISSLDARPRLEVGLVGSEGMLGASLTLGVDVSQLRAIVQGGGSALRMSAPQFSRELQHSPALEAALKRYVYVLMGQLAQMAACTHFHALEARLARWLLMTRDRAHSDTFFITQEFIAYMLGVRRVGVTHAAGALQEHRLIRYTRGNMTILDRRGLEARSCECYAEAKHMYDQVMN
jgi:CRP-like cAMP-binding protein